MSRSGAKARPTRATSRSPRAASLPETIEVRPAPVYGMNPGPFVYYVVPLEDGMVRLSRDKDGKFGPRMPARSLKHFKNDLEGRVDVPRSKNRWIEAVVSGRAELLGKGDDGLAFKVGDHVVKVSTTVPYQPENQGHLSPEEAVHRLREQTVTHNLLADLGGTCLEPAQFFEQGDKGFQVKPFVEAVQQFTRDELDAIQDCVLAIHKAGYAIRDTIQAGLGRHGTPVMFDVGKAERVSQDTKKGIYDFGQEADLENLARLYKANGQVFVRRDIDEGEQVWQHAVERAHAADGGPVGRRMIAIDNVGRAANKRRDVARARLRDEALKRRLAQILADEMHEVAILAEPEVDEIVTHVDKVVLRFGEQRHRGDESPEERIRSEIAPAVVRAVIAGAKPPLRYAGMGGEGIVICDGHDHAFKVGRSFLANGRTIDAEAEWFETASTLPAIRDLVATFVKYDPDVDVLERACVKPVEYERRMPYWKRDEKMREVFDAIQKEVRAHGWNAPEYKDDSFIETDHGLVLVDGGFVHRFGDRLVRHVADVLAGRRAWGVDQPEDLAFALRMDFSEPRPARVEELLAKLRTEDERRREEARIARDADAVKPSHAVQPSGAVGEVGEETAA